MGKSSQSNYELGITKIISLVICLLSLASCKPNGGFVTFTADALSTTPIREEKVFISQGHEFTYYNVYNDGNGNFVMADNTSYIINKDIQFGLRVGTPFVYTIANDGEDPISIKPTINNGNGTYDFNVDFGFQIRGISIYISMGYYNINIGTIVHWC